MSILFRNARIFTGVQDDLEKDATCVLINNSIIKYVGREDDPVVSEARHSGIQERDVQGRLICPGFIDGHMHILLFGDSLSAIQIDHCKNLEDIRETIRKGAQAQPDAPRLVVQGWMHFMTDSKALASDLDDLDPRPIYIYAKDLHSAWCNTAALDEMQISTMSDPEGGEISRDANGKPSGLLSEAAAIGIVWPHLNKVTSREEKLLRLRAAVRAYNQAGYTGAIELATDEEIWSLLTTLHDEQPLTLRIAAHWLIRPSKTTAENLAQVDRAIELHKQYNPSTSPDLRIAGIKIIGDGVVDACTASLSEPYTSPPGTNVDPIWSYEQLVPVVNHADAAGLQCALHAIGDRTVNNSINALAQLVTSSSLSSHSETTKAATTTTTPNTSTQSPSQTLRPRRHRIEHLELTSPTDAQRLGTLQITASIQPVHADPSILRSWPTLLGPHRTTRAFAYSEFAAHHAPLAIGTDAPTAAHHPLRNLYTATTRRSAREPDSTEIVNEQFKLGLGQAMRAASWGAAYSCFAEGRVGSLVVGMCADLVVLELEGGWDAGGLLGGSVAETWFGGRCVWEKEE